MTELPSVEQLTVRERLANFGKEFVRALGRNTVAFTGTPDFQQQVQSGLAEAEQFVNQPEN